MRGLCRLACDASSLIHCHRCRADDEAIDVYAFGLILYELVARRRPMVEDFVRLGRAMFYNAVTSGLCVSRRRAACFGRLGQLAHGVFEPFKLGGQVCSLGAVCLLDLGFVLWQQQCHPNQSKWQQQHKTHSC